MAGLGSGLGWAGLGSGRAALLLWGMGMGLGFGRRSGSPLAGSGPCRGVQLCRGGRFLLALGRSEGVPGCEGGGGDGSGSGSASELIVKSVTAAAVSGLTGSEERSSRSGRGTLAEGTPAPAGVLAL